MRRENLTGWVRRLYARIRYRHFDRDLREELSIHESMQREAYEAQGLTSDEARVRARLALGNPVLARDDARAAWIPALIDGLWADVRYASRGLVQQPGYTTTAVLTLAVALGLNSSLFSVFNALYIRSWPVADATGVFLMSFVPRPGVPDGGVPGIDDVPYAEFLALQGGATRSVLVGFGPRMRLKLRLDSANVVESPALAVSRDFFEVIRAPIQLGRGFSGHRVERDGHVAVISDRIWRTRFGRDPAVVGRVFHANETPTTVVGVLAPAFAGLPPEIFDVYVPFPDTAAWAQTWRSWWGSGVETNPAKFTVRVAGRIQPRWNRDQAAVELTALHRQLKEPVRLPLANRDVLLSGTAPGGRPGGLTSTVATIFVLLFAGGVLTLLLACANVGNLQVARGLARAREIATRLALGGSRVRVVRQLLTEGLLLALVAGGVGIGLAWLLPGLFLQLDPTPTSLAVTPDVTVLWVSLLACVAAVIAFALTPALQATRRGWLPWGSLTGRGVTISTRRTRSVILSVQIAVSAVLLVGAALLSRSLHRQITQDLAFVDGVLVGLIESPVRMDAERSRALAAAIEAAALPDMALVLQPPLGGGYRVDDDVALSGAAPEGARSAIVMSASSNFFHVLRLPFASGRSFGGGPSSINEVVVNESLARQLGPGGGVLGADIVVRRTIRTVVGVVADRHLTGPDDIRPMVFLPYTPGIGPRVLVRDTPQDEAAVLSAIVTGIDPQATIRVQPLGNWVPNAVRGSTIGVVLSSSIAVVALGLSAVGVFGVFWYVVEERRREIGIRLALGAHRANIIRTVFATARWSLLGGLGAGVILSAGGAAMLKGFLHGLSPLDPVSYAIVAVILCVTAAVATYVPARRAAGVDPATTLRSE